MCIVHFLNNSKSQPGKIQSTLLDYLSHLHLGFLLALLASATPQFGHWSHKRYNAQVNKCT